MGVNRSICIGGGASVCVLSAASSSIALHLEVFWVRGGDFTNGRKSGLLGLFELLEVLKLLGLLAAFETGESIFF